MRDWRVIVEIQVVDREWIVRESRDRIANHAMEPWRVLGRVCNPLCTIQGVAKERVPLPADVACEAEVSMAGAIIGVLET